MNECVFAAMDREQDSPPPFFLLLLFLPPVSCKNETHPATSCLNLAPFPKKGWTGWGGGSTKGRAKAFLTVRRGERGKPNICM